jgi:DGQHR domain-containing protein
MSDFQCAAIAVRQPSATFYVAAVKAMELEQICHPLARPAEAGLFGRETSEPVVLSESQLNTLVRSLESSKFLSRSTELLSEERAQPYQRFLDEKRAVEIARYLQQPSALLPNSIILAVNIDLDESDVVQDAGRELSKIVLPRNENSAVILDGQHRVVAFRYLSDQVQKGYEVLVAFLVGIPFYQQAELFAIINGKQKPVNRSIIYDLFGYAPVGGNKEELLYEGLMAISRFCSHVTRILNRFAESPWQSKIKMRGPGDEGVISQAAVVEYLSALVEPKKFTNRVKVLPLLYSFFKESDPAGCASLLILYLRAIQTALPQHWQNPKSLLWKNNGIAVMLRILHDDLMLAGSADELMNGFRKVIARWKKAPEHDLTEPPKTGGGGIQNQVYERFKNAMFSSDELQRLLEARDKLKDKLVEIGGLVL